MQRHTVINTSFDSLSSLTVGNGQFAFTVDATGLQSFPGWYARGVPLGTQSEWGWHSFTNTNNYAFSETLKYYKLNGSDVSYSVQLKEPERNKDAVNWFRQNPHRLQLGNIGFEIVKKDGSPADIKDIQNIRQSLDMWTGEIHSRFTVGNDPVDVITYCHQQQDLIAVKISSPLLVSGKIGIRIRLPYPNGDWKDVGDNWKNEDKHESSLIQQFPQSADIVHRLDSTTYSIDLSWKGNAAIKKKRDHYFVLTPSGKNQFEFSCRFDRKIDMTVIPTYSQTKANNEQQWKKFWVSGAAVDFSGSIDKRAKELERRIILSQYLTKIQCAGNYPPQETGLTYNSWYGKPHLEMHWWHAIHFALWGRTELLEKSLAWYQKVYDKAKNIA
ncbi:MAG: hypothetical protein ACHQFX_21400, partial [Chitinophagales bacterium]